MLRTEYNKSVVRDNAVIKMGRATGITNFSNSSKLRNIADILSNDIFLFSDQLAQSIDNIHEETARGNFLELLGSKHGVFKNKTVSYDILAQDQLLKIKPKNSNDQLSDIFTVSKFLYKGERFNIGSGITLSIIETVEINTSSTDVYISARLLSDGTRGIQFAGGDVIKINNTVDLTEFENLIIIEVQKDIALATNNETEEDYRARVIKAKVSRRNVAVKSAIDNILLEIPGKIEYAIYNNEGGAGNIDIYFITQKQKFGLEDTSILSITRLINSKLRSVVANGVIHSATPCTELKANIKYQYTSDIEIDIDTFRNIIYAAFYTFYKFSEENSVLIENLEKFVLQKLNGVISFNIVDISLFDASIQEYISYGNYKAIAPKGSFISLAKEDIEEF